MLKTTFDKEESKNVTDCNYKQFQWQTFEKDLTSFLRSCNGEYDINLIITKMLERLYEKVKVEQRG